MKINKLFTKNLSSPYDDLTFEVRKSEIRDPDGKLIFSQHNVVVPKDWSQVASDILAQKYFRKTGVPGQNGQTGGENDSRQVFHRLAGCWKYWGEKCGYFNSETDASNFYDEMCYMLSHQIGAPNSPQWFNTGLHYSYNIDGPSQGHYYVDETDGEIKKSKSAYERPQPHACFIQSISDDLVNENGIMDLLVREARLFKYGSGTGTNFSSLRSKGEPLSGGGKSSGLMSFLKVGDRAAGVIKSGGTTRRAAKMICLDLDHPEIEDFINWKVFEEQKVSALVAGSKLHKKHIKNIIDACFSQDPVETDPKKNPALKKALIMARSADIPEPYIAKLLGAIKHGKKDISFSTFDVDWQNEAYQTVSGQNSNNSVRIPNIFFEKLLKKDVWQLKWRTSGLISKEIPAEELWDIIATAAWNCADPGLQFDTTINEWHTCPKGGKINASNPCSEFMFLDDSACNLASINLIKFYDDLSNTFDVEKFSHAVRLWTIVLEISVLMAQYPSELIARKSYDYRPLGLGFANLGAFLMSMGITYGSPKAQVIAAAISALLSGEAYATSAEMASKIGAFPKYSENKADMLRVIRNHRRAIYNQVNEYENLEIKPRPVDENICPDYLLNAARKAWDRAFELGEKYGFRNAQVTVIAPTGTIGLLMDCDTTGIEPDYALVKFKKLAGGGYFRIINQSVPRALRTLGYSEEKIDKIIKYCVGHGSLKEAPYINYETLKKRGFTEDILSRIDSELPSAFDIRFVFNKWTLGDDFCKEKLGLTDNILVDNDFNLLKHLGFSDDEIEEANKHVAGTMTIEGAPYLKLEHYPVFDCANRCGKYGQRFLPYKAHIDMMASVQPFISGAISKTINLPNEATIDDVKEAFYYAWKNMLKAVSIYRDGSKLSQPLNAVVSKNLFDGLSEESGEEKLYSQRDIAEMARQLVKKASRRELPKRRFGYTVKATIGGQRVYLRTGEYDDGSLGEIFVDIYKEGAAYRSLMNAFAIAISMGLQYGVPLEEFVSKFHMFRFEPNGHVSDHDSIKFCSSIIDFIFRDLALNYLGRTDLVHVPPKNVQNSPRNVERPAFAFENNGGLSVQTSVGTSMMHTEATDFALTKEEWSDDIALASKLARVQGYEGDPCPECGQFTMVRSGTCLRCLSCGATSGCS